MKVLGRGFTLIELLVVLAIIASLLSVVAPRYLRSVDHSKENVLKEDLATLRDSIDKYYGDNQHYPASLQELADKHYIRALPEDPITESKTTWRTDNPPDPTQTGVYDVHSGAPGTAGDGTRYADW